MDINAAVGGKAGLSREKIEAALGITASADLSEREIVELTAQIAQENYNAKSNRPLRVDANNFCELPLPKPRG